MINVVIGPMGSGKSKKMLNMRTGLLLEKIDVVCFKPSVDTRNEGIHSRDGQQADAIVVKSFKDIHEHIKSETFNKETGRFLKNKCFMIDEVQFLNVDGLIDFVKYVQCNDIPVIAAGLNQTSEMKPFETTSKLCMYADKIAVISGKCVYCGKSGKTTRCTIKKTSDILVGDDIYQQACYKCFDK